MEKPVKFSLTLPKTDRIKLKRAAVDLGVSMNDLLLYFLQYGHVSFCKGDINIKDLKSWRNNGKSVV